MNAHPTVRQEHLTRAARIAEEIGNLPAVCTVDWCHRAAGALLAAKARSIICVTLGEFRQNGDLNNIEATGVNGHDSAPQYIHTESTRSLGWWHRTHSEVAASILSQGEAFSHWRTSSAGRRWAEIGVEDLAVAQLELSTPIGDRPGRSLVIEVGLREGVGTTFESADASVLAAVVPVLGRRCALAFGTMSSDPVNRITPREQAILEQLALGKTVKEIAEHLKRSPHTVHDHVKSLHRKLGATSRGELIARALGHIEGNGSRSSGPHLIADAEIKPNLAAS
ncbi:MAG: helix-turn-helix transcriptional regulator [Planctomycetota bacterium]